MFKKNDSVGSRWSCPDCCDDGGHGRKYSHFERHNISLSEHMCGYHLSEWRLDGP